MFLINAIRLIVEPYNALTAIPLPHFGFKKILQTSCLQNSVSKQILWRQQGSRVVASLWKKPQVCRVSLKKLPVTGRLTRGLVLLCLSVAFGGWRLGQSPLPVGSNSSSTRAERRSGGNLLPPFPFPHSAGCRSRVMEIKGVSEF